MPALGSLVPILAATGNASWAAQRDMLIALAIVIAAAALGVGIFRLWRWQDRVSEATLKQIFVELSEADASPDRGSTEYPEYRQTQVV